MITNTGLRPTSIISADLLIYNNLSSVKLLEGKIPKITGSVPFFGGTERYLMTDSKLESGDYIDGIAHFEGNFDLDFHFANLRGDLSIMLSHTKKPIRWKNIPIIVKNLIIQTNKGPDIGLVEKLDPSGKLSVDYLSQVLENQAKSC